jgi:hypothetical protein
MQPQHNQCSVGRFFMQGCGCAFGGCFGLAMICLLAVLVTTWGVHRAIAHAQQERAYAELQAEQASANVLSVQFVECLRGSKDEEAYRLTAPEFQAWQSLEQFRDYLTQHRDLVDVRVQDMEFEGAQPKQKHGCRVILASKDGGRVVGVMHLVRNDQGWQIDRLTLR